MAMSEHRITIVGCGPGSPDYVTPLARKAIEGAETLVGARRLLDMFSHSGERIVVGADIERVLDEVAARLGKSRIVILVTGDAGLCSFARPVLKRFGRDACEVIPGVSSVQVAFARIGLDWHDARILTAHGRVPEIDQSSLAESPKIAVLTAGNSSLESIRALVERCGEERALFLCENLTLPDESVRRIEPAELKDVSIASRTIALIIRKELLQ
jgi:precorrin-6y C5,15-methyltransferase (decarboxylating) CbiE subunit